MNLARVFIEGMLRNPTGIALDVAGRTRTYEALHRSASDLAGRLTRVDDHLGGLVGILAGESIAAYEGLLASLLSGSGYLPLNPTLPASRVASYLVRCGCSRLVADSQGAELLPSVLEALGDHRITAFLPGAEAQSVEGLSSRFPTHGIETVDEQAHVPPVMDPPDRDDELAYVMFTSGSTGEPKGVKITHANVAAFLDGLDRIYQWSAEDRFAQTFDLSFDASVLPIWAAWRHGAALCVLPREARTIPKAFIQNSEITVWSSVPSVGGIMRRLGILRPGMYPKVRQVLLYGEALPVEVAQAWVEAAPGATVDNHYGPTEATVLCTWHRWEGDDSKETVRSGLVPIGLPYEGTEVALVDADLHPVGPDETGELCLAGPQLSPGYWKDPERTDQAYVRLDGLGSSTRWYRTGDLAVREPDGVLAYLGRIDHQVKVMGYRVELGEIESCLRRETQSPFAVALPWPLQGDAATGIVACVQGVGLDTPALIEACRKELPPYMVPKEILCVREMPLNPNGKIDRARVQDLFG